MVRRPLNLLQEQLMKRLVYWVSIFFIIHFTPDLMPPSALRGLSEGAYAAGARGRRPMDPLLRGNW